MREARPERFKFIKGQCWKRRHKYRLQFAQQCWQKTRKDCSALGILAVRTYEDEHEIWNFLKGEQLLATWNPWSANFFCGDKQWHLHDTVAVMEAVRLCLSLLGS